MRIAFHVPRAALLKNAPGGENHPSGDGMIIANLTEALRKRGHEVKIVSRVDARDFWQGRLPARRLIAEEALVRGDIKRFSPDGWLVYFPRIMWPDLFGWWQHPKRYVILKGGYPGTPQRIAAMPRAWRELFTVAHRQSLKRADRIEAISPKSVRDLRSQGVPDERVCFLPRAIKPWTYVPSRAEARRVLGLPQEAPIVLCVSRLAPRRMEDDPRPSKAESVLDLLQAFRTLPSSALLVLVGDGRARGHVEEEAVRLNIAGRVHFAGTVEHADVVWYYAACDFFACPEKEEGNRPYQSQLEAQACGRAVVDIRNELSELTVDDGRTGLLANGLEEFAAHMRHLATDRELCDELGRAGPDLIARSFSIEVRARQIEEMLVEGENVSLAGVPRAGLEPATNGSTPDCSTN